ncbi:MAG: GNAT family N-acetyltransferase [Euryarchaeota archaeon]|nr:GNAT family N-acetyltransferase [Euryarchaeota archaeon]MDE1835784.1 GNAT family N-acetyltransferase [Euryarchaeota archaeon]MDE1880742.1 GNAT family N-acetyltransferase [Euryarchaeota archaeon]MDE2043975.1 GNAT family N-acetyltransferase [Thermoplasmata archaeon]
MKRSFRGRSEPPAPVSIVVRDARPGDRGDLERFHRGLQLYLAPKETRYHQQRLPAGYGRAYVKQSLDLIAKRGGFVLIAELSRRSVGFLTGLLQPLAPSVARMEQRPNVQGFVLDVFVTPSVRGKGVGQALFMEAERRFVARGCDNVQLTVLPPNLEARRFYERAGYEPIDLRLRKDLGTAPRSWEEARRRRQRGRQGLRRRARRSRRGAKRSRLRNG